MEVITTIFDQLQEDIHQRLRVLEKQIVFMLAQNQNTGGGNGRNSEAVDFLENKVSSLTNKITMLEYRLAELESRPTTVTITDDKPMERSAGLEGLLMKPIPKASPALSAISASNSVVLPMIQRQVVIQEDEQDRDDDVDVDEEAEKEMEAERQGGLTAEEEDEAEEEPEQDEGEEADDEEEQEEVEEEVEEQEEVEEEIELEEFEWKNKKYYKDQHNQVYRMVEEGVPEDEPFATYDEVNNKLTRIS